MGDLKEYEVDVNGVPTTVLLSDDDAKARGLSGGKSVDDVDVHVPEAGEHQKEVDAGKTKQADAPADKSAKSRDK